MVIDSSAVVAIAFGEAEVKLFASIIVNSPRSFMSDVNWLETLQVVEGRFGSQSVERAKLLLQELKVKPISFDHQQMLAAHAAWQRFGKGRHPAALNLADCCAYAAAVTLNEPLLFKGNDFALTDVPRVRW